MKRVAFGVPVVLLLLCLAGAAAAADVPAAVPAAAGGTAPVVRTYRVDGMIHGVTSAIVERGLAAAAAEHAALFVLELDTPGGLVDATEDIVRAILNSPVPVAVLVTPRGAHAASAGFFILLAGDVAAMSPVTRTGASSVITMGGENKEGDIALKKASQDLQALLRSVSRMRGRPADLAELAVKDAKSWSAEEALDAKLIDLLAENRDDLLKKLDGRTIRRPDGTSVTLALAGARVVEHSLMWQEDLKNVVPHPTIIALLLTIAVIGIYVEFTHPGLVLPGVVGAVALLVFLYGSHVLPVRYFAAALVAVGVVAFILEIKVVSYGMLSLAGALAIGAGLFLLFPRDVPGLALPLATLVPLALFLVAVVGGVTWLVARTARLAPTTGKEGLVGEEGHATSALDPEGTVFVHGEVWSARARESIPPGARVRVTGTEGLLLHVERIG